MCLSGPSWLNNLDIGIKGVKESNARIIRVRIMHLADKKNILLLGMNIPRAVAHFPDVRDNSSQEKERIRFILGMDKQHKKALRAEVNGEFNT